MARRSWTAAEVNRLRVLVHEGLNDEQIAGELGRSVRAIAIKRVLKMTVRTIGKVQPEERKSGALARVLRQRGWTCTPPQKRK